MRRLLVIIVLASFASVGLSLPSSAATVGLSVASTVKLVDGCKNVPVKYSVPSSTYWDLKISITASNGAIEDGTWLSNGSDPTSGSYNTTVCDYSMKPGRYTVTASYEGYDSNYNLVDTGKTTRAFVVAKSKSRTSLKISKKRAKVGQTVTIRSVSKAAGQRVEYGDVVVHLKRNGKKWKVWTRSTTDGNGKWSTRAEADFRGTAKFKVCTSAGDHYSKSCSSVKKIRVTR